MKRIIISVSNDLYSDQRVRKVCNSLHQMGFSIQLLGRLLPHSKAIPERPYDIKRFPLWFKKGPLFYANLNIRLFFYLLFKKTNLLLANDLDTLPANYLISKLKRIPLVYDTHEYYTEVPELEGRFSKKVWERIEAAIFPKLKDVFTVNQSISDIYSEKYGVNINVLKNLPNNSSDFNPESRESLGLEIDKKYIILQGAGINVDRGAEELVEAMNFVNGATLLIIGSGDVLPKLKGMVKALELSDKIKFIDKQDPERLKSFTYHAELGISIDKNTNLNYRFSLPNKIFDYLLAGIPILASDLPEVKKVVLDHDIGMICPDHQARNIAYCIRQMLEQDFKRLKKDQLITAAKELNWENQEHILKSVYQKYL